MVIHVKKTNTIALQRHTLKERTPHSQGENYANKLEHLKTRKALVSRFFVRTRIAQIARIYYNHHRTQRIYIRVIRGISVQK